jgi:hypothetical protein
VRFWWAKVEKLPPNIHMMRFIVLIFKRFFTVAAIAGRFEELHIIICCAGASC